MVEAGGQLLEELPVPVGGQLPTVRRRAPPLGWLLPHAAAIEVAAVAVVAAAVLEAEVSRLRCALAHRIENI